MTCLALALLSVLACTRPTPVAGPVAGPVASPAQPTPAQQVEALPSYTPKSPEALQGTLACVGSDSMDPLMQLWTDTFHQHYPNVTFSIASKGSGTAPGALVDGTSQIGHMSREMTPEELAKFQARFGYAPTRLVVAMDALAVYVNGNNPVSALTMEQVDAIFSTTRKGGFPKDLATWGDLGLGNEWTHRVIQPYGRDAQSGTRVFFREHALRKGDYKPIVKEVPDQFALVEAPAADASGISYGPIQHSVRMVKSVPIVDFKGTKPVEPSIENVLNGRYPLTRFLYIYVNRKPGQPVDPKVLEFVTYILSSQGQRAVADFGAVALPADLARINLGKIR
jgi:phosphate transport system substrate-binding protein